MNICMTIGELAKASNTKIVTVRYYEQVAILPTPVRSSGNYRVYGPDDLRLLRFVRRCRDLGFTLDEVRDLLRLSSQEARPCGEVKKISAQHLADIERKIADLTKMAAELRQINASCTGDGVVANCRIVEALGVA